MENPLDENVKRRRRRRAGGWAGLRTATADVGAPAWCARRVEDLLGVDVDGRGRRANLAWLKRNGSWWWPAPERQQDERCDEKYKLTCGERVYGTRHRR